MKRERLISKAEPYLLPGETIKDIFKIAEDFVAFLDDRVIIVDKEILSSKKEVSSIPYKRITSVGIRKGGFLGTSCMIAIYIGGKRFEADSYDLNELIPIYQKLVQISLDN